MNSGGSPALAAARWKSSWYRRRTTSLYLRPWNRYPSGVVPCSAACLSIASFTYSGSGMSRNSPATRYLSGMSCADGLTCSLTRRGLAVIDAAVEADGEGFADPQPAAVHGPDGSGPVRRHFNPARPRHPVSGVEAGLRQPLSLIHISEPT